MCPYMTFLCTKISRQLDYLFPLYGTLMKRRKNEETKPILKVHILETPYIIWLKFAMWGTDSGRNLRSKNCPVSCEQHKVSCVQNCIIVALINILMGVFLGPHYLVFSPFPFTSFFEGHEAWLTPLKTSLTMNGQSS